MQNRLITNTPSMNTAPIGVPLIGTLPNGVRSNGTSPIGRGAVSFPGNRAH